MTGSSWPNRTTGRAYFAAQAVAGSAWWVAVFTAPPVRSATLGTLSPLVVVALDIPLFVIASLLAALGNRWALYVIVPWSGLVALLMTIYATVTQLAALGALLMLASFAASTVSAVLVRFDQLPAERLLVGPLGTRVARAGSNRAHLQTTAAQIVLFWGCFLVVLPLIIVWFEERWGLHLPTPAWVRVSGLVLLLAASALGIWSAVSMATQGKGTPLPAATAVQLVVAGPYRWVRNPMAVAGIAQGVAVGLLLGSWLVVVYALCGSLVWNWAVRPHEEAELESRFGAAYRDYKDRVACWVPRSNRAR